MPANFVFGIPNYFKFTFRAGPKPPSLAQDNTDGESKSIENANFEVSREARTLAPSPSPGMGNTDSSPCGTLNKLPLEVRMMVYKNVLTYKRTIVGAHRFLGRHPPIMAEDGAHLEAIDAALLRTCRFIYPEAVRILYRRNRFHFQNLRDIEEFAHAGLGNTPFGFYHTASEPPGASRAPHGRLMMIRHLNLQLSSEIGNSTKSTWSSWCDLFYPPEGQDQRIGFPILEWLVLDFRTWKLKAGDESKVRVKPFLQKLRPKGGLNHLTLIGVLHEQNLRDFKHGFVRQGGTFRFLASRDKAAEDTTVTHDNLPEVSMYVRAIVEKDRASRASCKRMKMQALAT